MTRPPLRPLDRAVRCTIGLVLTAAATAVHTAPAHADHERLPSDRTLVPYVVERGDTASGLAVRFGAWTAEIVSHNHLDHSGGLRVGQRIEVPVVGRDGADGGDRGGKRGGKRGGAGRHEAHEDVAAPRP